MIEITEDRVNLIIENKNAGYITFNENVDFITGLYIYLEPVHRGKGYSQMLIKKFVEFAISKNKKIFPECSVIKKHLESDYKDILK